MNVSTLRKQELLLGLLAAALALPAPLHGQVPDTLTNVVVRVLPAEILFTWDPVPGADHYQIFSGGPNKRWIALAPTTNAVLHDGDFTDLPSFYRVAAVNPAGQVWQTPDLLVSNIPNTLTISHHAVRPLSDSAVAIGWAVTGGLADGVLEVGTGNGEPFFLAIEPGFQATHEFVVTNLVPGTTYWFRLTSADANRGGTIFRNTFTHQPIAPPPPVQVELFPPVAASFWVRDDAILPVQLIANTPEGSPGQFSITQPPTIGSLTGTPPNLTYVPGIRAERYVDLFRVGFSNGIESIETEVNVMVYWLSSEPYNQDQSFTSPEDSLGSFWLGQMDRSSFITAGPTNGVLLPWDQLPHVLYLPNTNFAGLDHFQFATLGAFGTGNVATVRIRVQPVPDAPVVQPQFITVTQDTTVAITAAVSDPDGGWYPLVISVGTSPLHGSIIGSGYKQFTYRPTPGYFGPDSFTYDYHDELFWGTATIDITVLRSNLPPFAQDQFVTTDFETALDVTLLASDPDGDAITYQVTTPPTSGTLSGTAPQLLYTPNTGFSGIDSLQYRMSDGQLDGPLAIVSLAVLPPAPPAVPTGLIATGVSRSQIDLQWIDNSRSEDGFEIERANDNKSWKLIATAGRDVRTYANTGLTGNKSYSYRVRAVNRFGASPFSATAIAGTLR